MTGTDVRKVPLMEDNMKKRRLIISIVMTVLLVAAATTSASGVITYETKTSVNTDGSYTFYVSAENEQGGEMAYQWYECDASGGNSTLIAGANGNVYQPQLSTETRYFYCKITYVSEDGEDTETTKIIKAEGHEEKKPDVEIMTFAINDINLPVTGENPDTTAAVSGSAASGCTVAAVSWDPKHSTFQPETGYTVTVTIKLAEGYKAGEGFKCTINGNSAVASGSSDGSSVECYYSFEPTEAIIEEEPADTPTDETENEKSSGGIPGAIWVIVALLLVIAAIILIVSGVKKKRAGAPVYPANVQKAIREEEAQQEDIRQIKKLRAKDRKNIQRQAQEDLDNLNRSGQADRTDKTGLQAEKGSAEKKVTRKTISRDTLERKVTKDTLSLQKAAKDEEIKNKQEDEDIDNNVSFFDDMPEDGKFDPSKFI